MRKVAGLELEEINYAKTGLSEDVVKTLVAKAGGVAAVLNKRHAIAKANNWAEAPPDAATFAKAVVKDVNLLRRPIVVAGKQTIIGFDAAAYDKLAK